MYSPARRLPNPITPARGRGDAVAGSELVAVPVLLSGVRLGVVAGSEF
jgi:hypothetical protein